MTARTAFLSLGLGAAAIGPCVAASECSNPEDYQLKIRNKSSQQLDELFIQSLEQYGIGQLRLSPHAAMDLCLKKPPAKCQTLVQVMYLDFPPISYERDICKEHTLTIEKE